MLNIITKPCTGNLPCHLRVLRLLSFPVGSKATERGNPNLSGICSIMLHNCGECREQNNFRDMHQLELTECCFSGHNDYSGAWWLFSHVLRDEMGFFIELLCFGVEQWLKNNDQRWTDLNRKNSLLWPEARRALNRFYRTLEQSISIWKLEMIIRMYIQLNAQLQLNAQAAQPPVAFHLKTLLHSINFSIGWKQFNMRICCYNCIKQSLYL